MNVGGWYDAGDFDLEEPAQLSVIQSLALAYREFDLKYDELMVNEAAREVEMHRPDGVPDTVEQVKHGALLILAQYHNIGHAIRGTHEPDLRQYTHLGDGASKTDGRIFDAKLGPDEVKGDRSGQPDDRWIFTSDNPYFEWNAIAALAAASDVMKGYDDVRAKDCLKPQSKPGTKRGPIQRHSHRRAASAEALQKTLQQMACWRPHKVQRPARRADEKHGATRALLQLPAHKQLHRPALAAVASGSGRTGPPLWS